MLMQPLVTRIDEALIDQTVARALQSTRLRAVHSFHPNAEANLHRFLNAFVRGTYCTPHQHREPPKAEGLVVLRGCLAVVIFDELGAVTDIVKLEHPNVGVDLQPGVWHTVVAVSDTAVCYETKPGPYDVRNDKQFAPWAPREGSAEAPAYLTHLEGLIAELT